MQRRFRRIFTSLKEHSSVSYAKIVTAGGFCDVDLIIIKATSPDDFPLPDRYVHELLKIFSFSPSSFRAFSLSFTRRFGKTHCWRVALKCLVLLHRLLRSVPENSPFRSELLWTRGNGLLSLYPCHFCDTSSSSSASSYDYTMFIRSYAQLLDEALDCFAFDNIHSSDYYHDEGDNDNEGFSENLSDKMKEVSRVMEVLPQLQSLIDRVMDCRPTGLASRSFIVRSAMKYIIRDSFICYTTFRTEVIVVLDNLFQMPYRSCLTAFGIYKKAAVQASHLCEFYDWCKATGLCGPYEYPFIERIPHIHIKALETFLKGMWQLTESSSSPTTASPLQSSSICGSPSDLDLDDDSYDNGRQIVAAAGMEIVVSKQWERFDEEEEPLIQLEEDNNDEQNVSWEALLEHSINFSHVPISSPNNLLLCYNGGYGNGMMREKEEEEEEEGEREGWKMQVYNPFHQSAAAAAYNMPANHNEYSASNSMYPWGL